MRPCCATTPRIIGATHGHRRKSGGIALARVPASRRMRQTARPRQGSIRRAPHRLHGGHVRDRSDAGRVPSQTTFCDRLGQAAASSPRDSATGGHDRRRGKWRSGRPHSPEACGISGRRKSPPTATSLSAKSAQTAASRNNPALDVNQYLRILPRHAPASWRLHLTGLASGDCDIVHRCPQGSSPPDAATGRSLRCPPLPVSKAAPRPLARCRLRGHDSIGGARRNRHPWRAPNHRPPTKRP